MALLFVAIIWGASYAIAKDALATTSVTTLVFFRFLIALAVLVPAAFRDVRAMSRANAFRSVLLGVVLSGIFLAETYGVFYTSASNAAFLISLCLVLTPLLDSAVKRQAPSLTIIGFAAISIVGTGVMVQDDAGFSLNRGDAFILIAAALRAVMVVATKRLIGNRAISSIAVTTLQFSTVMIVFALVIIGSDRMSAFAFPLDRTFLTGLLFLSLLCTLAAFFIQNWAVRLTSPTKVSFLMGTEPIFGAVFASILLSEGISTTGLVGAALILAGTYGGVRYS